MLKHSSNSFPTKNKTIPAIIFVSLQAYLKIVILQAFLPNLPDQGIPLHFSSKSAILHCLSY